MLSFLGLADWKHIANSVIISSNYSEISEMFLMLYFILSSYYYVLLSFTSSFYLAVLNFFVTQSYDFEGGEKSGI